MEVDAGIPWPRNAVYGRHPYYAMLWLSIVGWVDTRGRRALVVVRAT